MTLTRYERPRRADGLLPDRSKRLRVAFYCDSNVIGGAERSLGTLLEYLDERIDAIVIGTRPRIVDWLSARRPGVSAVTVPHVHRKRDVRAILAHVRAMRRISPDVLHLNLAGPWESHWAILASLAVPGARVVAVVHLPVAPTKRRQRLVKRLTNHRVAVHVTVGERSARELEQLTALTPKQVRTIPNGVPDVPVEPIPPPAPRPIIGSLGRLEPEKGFDLLLRALSMLPEANVIVVGEGSDRARLEALADELDLGGRVIFPGWSEDARRWLTAFDVFALPSRLEAFPLSVVEAMLASLPVVVSDVGSTSEAVEDGRTGLLVPPDDPQALADALRRLIGHPDLAAEYGRRARERAIERFGADAMARAYEQLYRDLADGASGARL